MVLIADASPLIFLAKVNQLHLIMKLFKPSILLPKVVEQEIMGQDIPPDEERILSIFLGHCQVIDVSTPVVYAEGLSFADNCVLGLAQTEQAGIILSDDRLLRRVAVIEGFQVIGTLGVLIQAKRQSLLSAEKAMEVVDELVAEHNFRISTLVYEAAKKKLLR